MVKNMIFYVFEKIFKIKYMLFFIILIVCLFNSYHTFSQTASGITKKYYTKKELDSNTKIFKYLEKYELGQDKLFQYKFYYEVLYNGDGKPIRENLILNNDIVSHYDYKYEDGQLIQEQYFDNQILISIRTFHYNSSGKLIRIEQYNKNKEKEGDWLYFTDQGKILKIVRYRDQKISFLILYKNDKIIETRYYEEEIVKVTKYNNDGSVRSEMVVDELKENEVSVIQDLKTIVAFKVNEINKLNIKSIQNELRCEIRNDHWVVVDQDKPIKADDKAIKNLLYNINNLQCFKYFRGKNIANKKYGFNRSEKVITLIDNKDNPITITIGDELKSESAYYVRNDFTDDEIFLVSKYKIDFLLNRKTENVRVRKLVHLSEDEVVFVSIDDLTFIKKQNEWITNSKPDANKRQTEVIISTILNMKAIEFLDEPNEIRAFNFLRPKHKIVLKTNEKKYEILIFIKEDRAYARPDYSSTIFEVPKYMINYLEKKKKSFTSTQ